MAFNWEKLAKTQRDYPKPKFALDAVNKLLKKKPSDPYLTAWKADISLQLNIQGQDVTPLLKPVLQRQPPVTDSKLLAYLYKLLIEATRRSSSKALCVGSVGGEGLKAWQNAAKSLQSREDRLNLWSDLFVISMRENCWEDVRMAIVQANKEGPQFKKAAYYALVLANQLAAERKEGAAEEGAAADPMTRILLESAYRQLKQAYEKPPDDLIQMKDMRDVRFMVEIFRRQNRCAELFELLDRAPPTLKETMDKYQSDIMLLKVQVLRERKEWKMLEGLCLQTIEVALKAAENGNIELLEELSSRCWGLWESLLEATEHSQDGKDKLETLEERWKQCFESKAPTRGREVALTEMALSQYFKRSLLQLCKDYWQKRSYLNCCFDDLRRYVEQMPTDDQKEFYSFISISKVAMPDSDKATEATVDKWLQAEVNALKFGYLLTISLPELPAAEAIEGLVGNSLRLYQTGQKLGGSCQCDAGYLAVIGLLKLHHRNAQGIGTGNDGSGKATSNSRILLQATVLARHLIASEVGKQNRTLVLLSTRLHLNLGLGTIAFRQYTDAKVKEMLKDTVAPIVLSRISRTHPFETKGHTGFSAKEELLSVLNTLEKMEMRTEDFVYVDMKSFQYDQAIELLGLKDKLSSSLTKHICTMESRRISRLRGDPVDIPFDLHTKDRHDFTDSIDLSVFPNFEASSANNIADLIIPATIPSADSYTTSEKASQLLYKESTNTETMSSKPNHTRWTCPSDLSTQTPADHAVSESWSNILAATLAIKNPNAADWDKSDKQYFTDLLAELPERLKGLEMLVPSASNTASPEDEPPLFHENMLMLLYANLELIRGYQKLTDLIRDTVLTKKGAHPLSKKIARSDIDSMAKQTEACFELVRKIAQGYIDALKGRGQKVVEKQVRWGATGRALGEVLTGDDVEFYAGDMVGSAVEALGGVLKVKLR